MHFNLIVLFVGISFLCDSVHSNIWDNLFSNQQLLKKNNNNFLIKTQDADGKLFLFSAICFKKESFFFIYLYHSILIYIKYLIIY